MMKLRYLVKMGMALTLAAGGATGCGADGSEPDVSSSSEAIYIARSYWRAGGNPAAGSVKATCAAGEVMVGLSLGSSTVKPQILCGYLPTGLTLNPSSTYPGNSTRDTIFPSCHYSPGNLNPTTDAAISWQIDYPSYKTTVECQSSISWQLGYSYVDDVQGQGTFKDANGKSFYGHRCSRANSYVVGYNGDHDLLDCAY